MVMGSPGRRAESFGRLVPADLIPVGFARTALWTVGVGTKMGNRVRLAESFGRLAPVSSIPVGFARMAP